MHFEDSFKETHFVVVAVVAVVVVVVVVTRNTCVEILVT